MRDDPGPQAADPDSAPISDLLLGWYDHQARDLPWRIGPAAAQAGQRPDPYRVWLSEIMLQQTTVAAVRGYFLRFTQAWPDLPALAAAEDARVMAEWAGLGYYARARNLLKCARTVMDRHGGLFPDTETALLDLPGIGPYTAAAIAAIAFDRPAVVLDGNVERVMARLHDLHDPLPGARPALRALAARHTPTRRPGDHAQAVMDLGATVCTPKSPDCAACPLTAPCRARAAGTAASLPRKSPKPVKPHRLGTVYLAQGRDGAWLLQRRPDQGLLGGMLGFPGTDWTEAPPPPAPPFAADWRLLAGRVRHTFTHFHLELTVATAPLPDGPPPPGLLRLGRNAFRPADLPTVMRKAHALWQAGAPHGQPGPGAV